MSIVVRPALEPDLAAADQLLRAAFARTASYLPHLRLQMLVEPSSMLVAEESTQLRGTVAAINYGSVAYLGLMAVDPTCQRRGIARQLVKELLARLDAVGCELILLDATPQGVSLYEEFGFETEAIARVFEWQTMLGQETGVAADVDLVVDTATELEAGLELEELIALDAAAFGINRRKLLRALWDLYRDRLLIIRDEAKSLAGYLFARDPVLGPWVALNDRYAGALLQGARRFEYQQTPHVMVPRSNEVAAEVLRGSGFVELRSLRHMRRGKGELLGQTARLFGQSSFAHG